MIKAELFDAAAGRAEGTIAVALSSTEAIRGCASAMVDRWVVFGRVGSGPVGRGRSSVRTGRNPRTGETVMIAATKRMVSAAGATRTAA